MDKVQKIRKEVEKLHGNPYYMMAVKDILEILDMQEEPVSEDLEEAAKKHAAERYRTTRDRELAEKCKWSFISGAEWYKKHNNKN